MSTAREPDRFNEEQKAARNQIFGRLGISASKKIVYFILFLGAVGYVLQYATNVTSIFANVKSLLNPSSKIESFAPTITHYPLRQKSPLEEERVKGLVLLPCDGHHVDIVREFSDVDGKESNIWSDSNDLTIFSASESASFQIAKRYPFECAAPWIATVSAITLGEKSIGMFFEFEDVFKILIGDGDSLNWKVEKNDSGRKEKWTQVLREKLSHGKISVGTQITLIVKAKQNKNSLILDIKIGYRPEAKKDYMWEERKDIFVKSEASDLSQVPERKFRIGINDSKYRGLGSLIKFQTFQVKKESF